MRSTMVDVAKRAGVSTSTVSLVLNDKPGVSDQVRAAVLQGLCPKLGRARPRENEMIER